MSVLVNRLRKTYGPTVAVEDVSFFVPTGSLFAFLGTNGAGKSTTIGCMTTVVKADAGTIEIDGDRIGVDDVEIRRRIGVVFQASILDPLLTVRENLELRAAFYGLRGTARTRRIDELVESIDLGAFQKRRYGKLSGGQKRRADIARALVHEPSLVFLDEPTTGLDPQSREDVWNTIQTIRRVKGTTVFLTTHYMPETEAADAVCIIDQGRIVAHGTPAGLRGQYSSSILTLLLTETGRQRLHMLNVAAQTDRDWDLVAVQDATQAWELLGRLGSHVQDFEFRHGTMDDVFLALTNRRPEP